jgi:hypothetical protein
LGCGTFVEAHGAVGQVGEQPPEIFQAIVHAATEAEAFVELAMKGLL